MNSAAKYYLSVKQRAYEKNFDTDTMEWAVVSGDGPRPAGKDRYGHDATDPAGGDEPFTDRRDR